MRRLQVGFSSKIQMGELEMSVVASGFARRP